MVAGALGPAVSAVARPPRPARMGDCDILALDGRRLADLRLATGAQASLVAVACAEHLSDRALAAFGFRVLARPGALALVRTADRTAASDRSAAAA